MDTSIFESNVNYPEHEFRISLTAIDGELFSFGLIRYMANKAGESIVIDFIFGDEPAELTIRVESLALLSTSCLLLCGLPIAGAVLDCYRKNKKNWKGFKKCMEDQGNTVGASAIACILACQK